ncbi:MAG: polysaccharide deacetylase family protein [Bacteroidales bacterium]|nr:polysaccharide deacetylase family protein [Bacteroidales bacterium]
MEIPGFVKSVYSDAIWNIVTPNKELYITFDDGPNPELTPEILNILKQFNAKATFFCVGENVQKYPDTYNLVIKDGHKTGNHTFNHLKGWRTKINDYLNNVELASRYIQSNLFRPPYGRLKIRQYKALKEKYKVVFWSVLSLDYSKNITKKECLDIVLKNSKPGSIILFHDSNKMRENVLYALPRALEYFQNKNYTFLSLK